MTPTHTLSKLETSLPEIKWREPLPVKWEGDGGVYKENFTCRVCIATMGFNQHSLHQWPTQEEAEAHIVRAHLEVELQ